GHRRAVGEHVPLAHRQGGSHHQQTPQHHQACLPQGNHLVDHVLKDVGDHQLPQRGHSLHRHAHTDPPQPLPHVAENHSHPRIPSIRLSAGFVKFFHTRRSILPGFLLCQGRLFFSFSGLSFSLNWWIRREWQPLVAKFSRRLGGHLPPPGLYWGTEIRRRNSHGSRRHHLPSADGTQSIPGGPGG